MKNLQLASDKTICKMNMLIDRILNKYPERKKFQDMKKELNKELKKRGLNKT